MRRTPVITAALTLGITLVATGAAISQPHASGMSPERLERVTAVLDKYIAAGELAGAVSLIYRHGEIAHLSARGFQDKDGRTPMQRDTIFGLASMTKPVTAVAAMMLLEEGRSGSMSQSTVGYRSSRIARCSTTPAGRSTRSTTRPGPSRCATCSDTRWVSV